MGQVRPPAGDLNPSVGSTTGPTDRMTMLRALRLEQVHGKRATEITTMVARGRLDVKDLIRFAQSYVECSEDGDYLMWYYLLLLVPSWLPCCTTDGCRGTRPTMLRPNSAFRTNITIRQQHH